MSTGFKDASGDRITFYLVETGDGYRLEDDGDYLAHLIARDIPVDEGVRGQLLDSILEQSGAFWDRETFEIKTSSFTSRELSARSIDFLSSLIRLRDLELVTRDIIRSTFKEDVISAMSQRFGPGLEIEENAAPANDFAEFPADIVARPHTPNGRPGAIYLVSSNDKLNEALLASHEAQLHGRHDFAVVALIEEPDMKLISRKKFQRAQNRGLSMPIFRGDEDAALARIGHEIGMARVGAEG